MVHRPSIDADLCFVLMPFRSPFNGYYEKIIKPTVIEAGMRPLRADEVYGTRAIIRDVWDSIWSAAVIVADVTDRNPNVNYELGLCHALGVPTILLTRREEDVPFDYRHRRYIRYNTEDAGWEAQLRQDLRNTLRAVRSNQVEEELPWPYRAAPAPSGGTSLYFDHVDSRALVVEGVRRVREIISRAFGPHGGSIAGREAGELPLRRGSAIVEIITSTNPLEQRGIAEMQQIAHEQMLAVGDGTKTAMLLAAKLIESGDQVLRGGHSRARVFSGIREGIEAVLALLESTKKNATAGDFSHVGVTAGGKRDGVSLAADAVGRFGSESYISVESADDVVTVLNVWEGMRIDAGYASEYFITDPEAKTAVLENCFILPTDHSVASMQDLLPILEAVARRVRPLVIFSAATEGEALATLITNKLRGTISCAAVNLPAGWRGDLITDIAAYCGAAAVKLELGTTLRGLRLQDLGRAKKVVVDRYMTQIIGGEAREDHLTAYLQSLRTDIAESSDALVRARLRDRLLRLKSNMAVVSVGGRTRLEKHDAKSRAEAALASCRAAAESGVVAGGGAWLIAAAGKVQELSKADEAVEAGRRIVAEALEQVARIVISSSSGGEDALDAVRRRGFEVVFDTTRAAVVPLTEARVFDAVGMLRSAIEIAYAHANGVLGTVSWDNVFLQSTARSAEP